MILPQPLASFCTSILWKALSTHLKVLVLTSLENAVKHAKAFETAQLEQTRLHSHPDTPAACISDYKNYQNGPSSLPNNPKPDKGTQPCSGYGSYFLHGQKGQNNYPTKCPTWVKQNQ